MLKLTLRKILIILTLSIASTLHSGHKFTPLARVSCPEELAVELGMDLTEYRILRDLVINHETGGSFDPKQLQVKGPARGLFQIEGPTLITNANRLATYKISTKQDIPDYVFDILFEKIKGADELTAVQQEMLFITGLSIIKDGELHLHPLIKNKKINNIEDVAEIWLKIHNRTNGPEAETRRSSFISDSARYLN